MMDLVARDLAPAVQRSSARLGSLRHELIELRERRLLAMRAAAAELTEFARSEQASRELRSVQRSVDRGELTWQRVALGEGDLLRKLLGERLARLPEAFAEAYRLAADGLAPREAARRSAATLTGVGEPAETREAARPGGAGHR